MSENRTIYAVQFGNYSPPEIDSLWTTFAEARRRADGLRDSMWEVVSMPVWENQEDVAGHILSIEALIDVRKVMYD